LISNAPSLSTTEKNFHSIQNMGVANAQMFQGSNMPIVSSSSAVAPTAINTATDQSFTFNGQLATATDFIFLASSFLQVINP
jgi:hypothetical protein